MLQPEGAKSRFLGDYLFSESPGELLIVGHLPVVMLASAGPDITVCKLPTLSDAEAHAVRSPPDGQQMHQTLVLALEGSGHECEIILGRAMRSFPHRVFVHCGAIQDGAGLSDESFFALGFRKLSLVEDADTGNCGSRWFEYRLSDYKTSPDWLNARFWANPERFDVIDDPDGFGDYADEEE